jgi:hypothetical protein
MLLANNPVPCLKGKGWTRDVKATGLEKAEKKEGGRPARSLLKNRASPGCSKMSRC